MKVMRSLNPILFVIWSKLTSPVQVCRLFAKGAYLHQPAEKGPLKAALLVIEFLLSRMLPESRKEMLPHLHLQKSRYSKSPMLSGKPGSPEVDRE